MQLPGPRAQNDKTAEQKQSHECPQAVSMVSLLREAQIPIEVQQNIQSGADIFA
jgi:hypothetical protein